MAARPPRVAVPKTREVGGRGVDLKFIDFSYDKFSSN
jgi:hypothetical protein